VQSHNSQPPHRAVLPIHRDAKVKASPASPRVKSQERRSIFGSSLAGGVGSFIVIFTAFLLLLIWGAVAFQLRHDRLAVLDAARVNTRNLARAYAEHVFGTLRLLDQVLLRIKAERENNAASAELVQNSPAAVNINSRVVPIGVTNEQGDIVASNMGLPRSASGPQPSSSVTNSAADRDYFLALVHDDSGKVYVSEPIVSRITGKQVIALSRRLNKPDGTFAGVVFASIDPEYLSGFFSDLAIGKNSSFAVIGRDMIIRDMIRGSGRATELIGKSVPNPHLLSALAQVADGDYEAVSSLDGVARIYSYRALQNYPLVVLASAAEPEIFATYNERKTWIIAAAAALSLVFVCVASYQLSHLAEEKRNEVALKNSRENLARAQRIANIGSFDHDLATNKAEWSDELYRLYGLALGEAGGDINIALPFVHPEDREKFLSIKDQVNNRVPSASVDFRVVRRDGVERILHRQSDLIFDESGVPVRIAGTLQDITERKNTELEISRSRENLARAQQIASIGSFEHDTLTGKVEWSDEMYRILGLEKTGAVPGSETLLELIHHDDRDRFNTYRSRELEEKSVMPFECRVVRPDGVERIVRRESVAIFDDEGRLIRRYGTLQDITELRVAERRERELERQLLHSQKLEALGTLAGGIAHDLNNTLTPIMALSKVAARRLEPGDALRANLETIFTASEQARDLVKRVLAFSRRDKVDKKPTSLSIVVTDALKLLCATIPSSIQLESRIGDAPAILADASQIQQVVTNLVMNAAQAIGNGMGVITVVLERASALPYGEAIKLSVIDNGKGMDEATRLRIFEPFFTTKEVGQGTGLGLSIIDGIVTDHGGRIEVESELGRGTRFDVHFPLPEARSSVAA